MWGWLRRLFGGASRPAPPSEASGPVWRSIEMPPSVEPAINPVSAAYRASLSPPQHLTPAPTGATAQVEPSAKPPRRMSIAEIAAADARASLATRRPENVPPDPPRGAPPMLPAQAPDASQLATWNDDVLPGADKTRQCALLIEYGDAFGEITVRPIVTFARLFDGFQWWLAAWCGLRSDWRTFIVDRIIAIKEPASAKTDVTACLVELDVLPREALEPPPIRILAGQQEAWPAHRVGYELPPDLFDLPKLWPVRRRARFHYTESDGVNDTVEVEIESVGDLNNGTVLAEARSRTGAPPRWFLAHQIRDFVDLSTNTAVADPAAWAWSIAHESAAWKAHQALRSVEASLDLLLYIGRADGALRANERKVIAAWVLEETGCDPELRTAIDAAIKEWAAAGDDDVDASLRELAGKPLEWRRGLMAAIERVADAGTSKNDADEAAAVERLRRELVGGDQARPAAPAPERLADASPSAAAAAPPRQAPALPIVDPADRPRILFVDTETTGTASYDRIVSLGIVETRAGRFHQTACYLVFDPRKDSHPEAVAIHGWDDWTMRHQDLFADHAEYLHRLLSSADLLVMHNAAFDLRFLNREFQKAGLPELTVETRCTMHLARQHWPGERASLDACLARIGLARASRRHGAFEDAFMAMNLFRHMAGASLLEPAAEWPQPSNFNLPPPRPDGPLPRRTIKRRAVPQ